MAQAIGINPAILEGFKAQALALRNVLDALGASEAQAQEVAEIIHAPNPLVAILAEYLEDGGRSSGLSGTSRDVLEHIRKHRGRAPAYDGPFERKTDKALEGIAYRANLRLTPATGLRVAFLAGRFILQIAPPD